MSGATTNTIAFQGAEEFFNTFTMMWSYDKAKEITPLLLEYLGLAEGVNPYLKEAAESAIQLIETVGLFKLIQFEEKFLILLFDIFSAILAGLMALSKAGWNKLKNSPIVGRQFKFLQRVGGSILSDAIEKGKMLIEWLKALISARTNSYQAGNLMQSAQANRDSVMQRDRSAMMLGQGVAQNLIGSLDFKIKTKSFTAKDGQLLKRILGRDSITNEDIERANQIADTYYVHDVNGKQFGVADLLMALLHGTGAQLTKASAVPA